MTRFALTRPVSFLKKHAPALVLGMTMLCLLLVVGACLFILYGPASDRDIIRIQEKQQPAVNLEHVDALLEKLESRAPALRSNARNPFLNPEGLTTTPGTE